MAGSPIIAAWPQAVVAPQVMVLGAPVTAVTLSPAMDLLATAHAGQRGIFLWSNQCMFGSGAEVPPPHPFLNSPDPSPAIIKVCILQVGLDQSILGETISEMSAGLRQLKVAILLVDL